MLTGEGYEKLAGIWGGHGRADRLARAVATLGPKVLSVDVFDTLLLRGTRPEFVRFADVARLQSRALRQAGLGKVEAEELLAQRLRLTRLAYQRVRREGGEVVFGRILEQMCQALALPDAAAVLLLGVETQYEGTVLRSDRALAQALAVTGLRLVLASDTPLPTAAVVSLLERCGVPLRPDAVYVSSDLGATKRDGTLFSRMVGIEGIAAHEWLHVGDNPHSDGVMARKAGMNSLILPRALPWRLLHGWRHGAARAKLRRQGLVP